MKLLWALRRLTYSVFMRSWHPFGYFGKPIRLKGAKNIILKKKSRIMPGARLETHGLSGSIVFEENVSVGQNLHCTAASKLVIGANTVVTANVCITDIVHSYKDSDLKQDSKPITTNPTYVGRNCFIGFGAVILPGTYLGDNSVVGANAVVKGVYPEGSILAGNPAKVVKMIDEVIDVNK